MSVFPAKAYRAVYEPTEAAISHAEGLVLGLSLIAEQHPGLHTNTPEDAAFLAVMRCLEAAIKGLSALHEAEWAFHGGKVSGEEVTA